MAVYVMSDVHGLYDKFMKMIQLLDLKEEDHVYFLGDVIDRGNDGIKILQYIFDHPQFTLLMGNHEYMMLQTLDASKGSIDINMEYIQWFMNGAETTVHQFLELSTIEQQEIHKRLKALPIAITDLKVNDRSFYLVHGCCSELEKEGTLYLDDVNDVLPFLWQRVEPKTIKMRKKILVAGHTMTTYYHDTYTIYHSHRKIQRSKYIDIDCGCSHNNEACQFAALRLDDFQEFYVK